MDTSTRAIELESDDIVKDLVIFIKEASIGLVKCQVIVVVVRDKVESFKQYLGWCFH